MIDSIVNVVSYVLFALAVITATIETGGYFAFLLENTTGMPERKEYRAHILPVILFIGAALAKYIAS